MNDASTYEVIETAINNSEKNLKKLYLDGTAFVNNVSKAAEDRESHRKSQEQQNSTSRFDLVESKALEAEEQYNEIYQKCLSTKKETYCLTIYNRIEVLKKDCDKLLAEKDSIIKYISEELRKKESDYVQEIKREEEDTKVITNRVDKLLLSLSQTCNQELNCLQTVFDTEYQKLVDIKENEWQNNLFKIKDDESVAIRERERMMLNYQDEVQNLERLNFDDFRRMKRSLDEDLHALQRELSRTQGVHLLNTEKLEYSFEVLRKQVEENKSLRVEQKRARTKLHDTMVELKREIKDLQTEEEKTTRKTRNEIREIREQIKTLEQQLWHVQTTEMRRFKDVWLTKEEEAKYMLEKVLDTDRYVAEKILNVTWERPKLDFLNNAGPIYISSEAPNDEEENDEFRYDEPVLDAFNDNVIDSIPMELIFKMIAEEMGFLLEDNVKDVVNPLEDSDVRSLDTVFRALNIENDSDVALLRGVFSKYAPRNGKSADIHLEIDVAKALKEFLSLKKQLKDSFVTKQKFDFPVVDDEKSMGYWRKYTHKIIDEDIWKTSQFALLKYRKILRQQESLLARKNGLIMQNRELENAVRNVS